MKDGFVRVAAATPVIRVADPAYNAEQIIAMAQKAPQDTALLVFPELCLTGYTCEDLFGQAALLAAAEEGVKKILTATLELEAVLVVGVPVAQNTALYNCAAVCHQGKLLGLVPKAHIPSYGEFYEGRHFSAGDTVDIRCRYAGQETRLCRRQLFACEEMPCFVLGVEICEDLWVTTSPSSQLVSAGATVIANLSASSEGAGKDAYRRQLIAVQSGQLHCTYVYADAGEGESTADMVFAGINRIAENGTVLAESQPYTTGITAAETDLMWLAQERRRITTYMGTEGMDTVYFSFPQRTLTLEQTIDPAPFVPSDAAALRERCEEVLAIQTAGLARRLQQVGGCAVLGISGGLDSTLALLVTVRAFDRLGLNRSAIHAVTMPCFGTTVRTKSNAVRLAEAFGATLHEIDIHAAVTQHLSDIGHPQDQLDITYENAQARERTQVLMDLSNRLGGIVIGTGDLSELALGWATYNGDHMSMYGVNASVPKTLLRPLVEHEAARIGGTAGLVLADVANTPVSPELLPPKDGEIAQKTEELVGPYRLHDFYLYYMLRGGCAPKKLYRLAKLAFAGEYDNETLKRWLKVFLRRFFTQQFKRSCLPDGPRVGSVSLSPRGDWRMPSDASAAIWLKEAEEL